MPYRVIGTTVVIFLALFVQLFFNDIFRLWFGNRLQLMESIPQGRPSWVKPGVISLALSSTP